MPDTKYKAFAERLLLYNITSEPTESTFPILSYVPTAYPTLISYLPTTPVSDCNMSTYVIISAATSVFTTLCVIFTAYYLREKCKAKYLGSVGSSVSSLTSESISSHIVDMEPGNTDELFWFEDVYVDQ